MNRRKQSKWQTLKKRIIKELHTIGYELKAIRRIMEDEETDEEIIIKGFGQKGEDADADI